MTRELYINFKKADLPETKFTFSLQVNDFFDLKSRQSSYSENIKLPKTANNARIFELAGAQPNNSIIPYQKLRVDYIVDGVPIVQNGWGFLQETNGNYNFHFLDGNIDLYRAIENLKLTDLPFDDFTHQKSIDAIIDTWENDLPYVYALADYGGIPEYNNGVNIDFLVPSISFKWIWDRMFEITGFRYRLPEGIFDKQFLTISDAYADVSAEGAFDTVYDVNELIFSDVSSYNQTLGAFAGHVLIYDENSSNDSSQNPEQIIKYEAEETGLYDISFNAPKMYPALFGFPFVDLPMPGIALSTSVSPSGINSIIPGSLKQFVANTEIHAYELNYRWQNIHLNAGQTIYIVAICDNETFIHPETLDPSEYTIDPTQVQVIYKPISDVSLPEYLSDLPLKDLFNEILIQKALTPILDNKTGVYNFYTLDERLNAPIVDWSDKPLIFKSEKYDLKRFARNNHFTYKYNDEGDNHNDATLVVPNEQLKDSDTIASKFYGAERTPTEFTSINKTLPNIKLWKEEVKENNDETSIEYKELKNHYHWLLVEKEQRAVNLTSKAYGSGSSANVVKYANFEPFKWDNVLKDSYSNIGKVVNKMKLNEYLIPLNSLEIRDFNFFCRIYHKDLGALFIPNSIKYESEDLSYVELIKIDPS